MNFYLLPAIELGPVTVKRLLRLIPAHRMHEALHPDRFTPREIAAHLADWEPIMCERIQSAVTTPGATITAYDEGQMAIDHRYRELDPHEQAERYLAERQTTAAFIRSLTPAQWANAVHHPERGPQSTEDLANLLLGHDLYHIEQLSEYLQGTPAAAG
jgi:hypothetical protein